MSDEKVWFRYTTTKSINEFIDPNKQYKYSCMNELGVKEYISVDGCTKDVYINPLGDYVNSISLIDKNGAKIFFYQSPNVYNDLSGKVDDKDLQNNLYFCNNTIWDHESSNIEGIKGELVIGTPAFIVKV